MPNAETVLASGLSAVGDWVKTCRPKHWLKNSFVVVPAAFSEHYGDVSVWIEAFFAFACFCPLSSAMYLLNDVVDRKADASHPRKRLRPVAAGRILPIAAIVGAISLMAIAVGLAAILLPVEFLAAMGAYTGNTLLYIFLLKNRVIVDVMLIAIGFVIRLLAGSIAVEIEPSSWLLLCGFSLALVLGFGKRRAEVETEGVNSEYRSTLMSYSRGKLDTLLGVTTATCLLSYMLYTVAAETIALHGTNKLIYTVPLVAYGLFRYLFKSQEGRKDGPTDLIIADPVFPLTGLLWIASVIAVFLWK